MKHYKKIICIAVVIIFIIIAFMLVFEYFYDTHKKSKYNEIVELCSQKYSVDESLIFAVIKAESNFNVNAKSNKGACGLMQIKPQTFSFVCLEYGLEFSGKDIFDADKNIQAGVCYLRYLLNKFNDYEVAVCAYNAGEGNVLNWLKDKSLSDDGKTLKEIPFKETKSYLTKVKFYKKVFERL